MKRDHINLLLSTKTCNLDCNFCILHSEEGKKIATLNGSNMSLETFKKAVDKCIEYGITSFDLTPYTNDIFNVPSHHLMLQYIISKGVYFEFVTNFINVSEYVLNMLEKTDNYEMAISIYGLDEIDYFNNTNTDVFKIFKKNMEKLKTRYPNVVKNTRLYFRCDTKDLFNE
jgi:sulfatase maturation enzyme AslB (radical SAM superfamily)